MNESEKQRRFHADGIDSYDEEFEMEVDDRFLDSEQTFSEEDRLLRKTYFRELFRLQGELVKLQDWVQHTGHRLVVLFEGRDAAGRRDQAHHAASEPARVPHRRAARAE